MYRLPIVESTSLGIFARIPKKEPIFESLKKYFFSVYYAYHVYPTVYIYATRLTLLVITIIGLIVYAILRKLRKNSEKIV